MGRGIGVGCCIFVYIFFSVCNIYTFSTMAEFLSNLGKNETSRVLRVSYSRSRSTHSNKTWSISLSWQGSGSENGVFLLLLNLGLVDSQEMEM